MFGEEEAHVVQAIDHYAAEHAPANRTPWSERRSPNSCTSISSGNGLGSAGQEYQEHGTPHEKIDDTVLALLYLGLEAAGY